MPTNLGPKDRRLMGGPGWGGGAMGGIQGVVVLGVPFRGPSNFIKRGGNVACVHVNAPHFISTYPDPPPHPLINYIYKIRELYFVIKRLNQNDDKCKSLMHGSMRLISAGTCR